MPHLGYTVPGGDTNMLPNQLVPVLRRNPCGRLNFIPWDQFAFIILPFTNYQISSPMRPITTSLAALHHQNEPQTTSCYIWSAKRGYIVGSIDSNICYQLPANPWSPFAWFVMIEKQHVLGLSWKGNSVIVRKYLHRISWNFMATTSAFCNRNGTTQRQMAGSFGCVKIAPWRNVARRVVTS